MVTDDVFLCRFQVFYSSYYPNSYLHAIQLVHPNLYTSSRTGAVHLAIVSLKNKHTQPRPLSPNWQSVAKWSGFCLSVEYSPWRGRTACPRSEERRVGKASKS